MVQSIGKYLSLAQGGITLLQWIKRLFQMRKLVFLKKSTQKNRSIKKRKRIHKVFQITKMRNKWKAVKTQGRWSWGLFAIAIKRYF